MITMTYFKARASDGQLLAARDMDEMATRTCHAGDEYTSWSLYQVDDSGESYVGYMIAGQFTSLDEIAQQTADYEPVREDLERRGADYGPVYVEINTEPPPPRTLAEYECMAADNEPGTDPEDPYRAYDEGSSHEEVAADHELDLDELLADPEVAAEADRILAGEGGTILGIPFAPSKPQTERGE